MYLNHYLQAFDTIGLTAAASATDAATHKKMFGSGTTTLIVSNEEMNVILKIIKSLEESGLLIKDVIEIIKNEGKKQTGGFFWNVIEHFRWGKIRAGKGIITAGQGL